LALFFLLLADRLFFFFFFGSELAMSGSVLAYGEVFDSVEGIVNALDAMLS
jgi:hypothetical protein